MVIPLIKGVHRWSVDLDEIHVGSRDRDLEEFPTEMRHGVNSLPHSPTSRSE